MKAMFAIAMAILLPAASARATNEPSIVPLPARMEAQTGTFEMTANTEIAFGGGEAEARKFAAELEVVTGLRLRVAPVSPLGKEQGITFLLQSNRLETIGAEGYMLTAKPQAVVITAATEAGLFHGGQTLLQFLSPEARSTNLVSEGGAPRRPLSPDRVGLVELAPPNTANSFSWQMPCVEITDGPRFSWRGLMLDCSRTFQSVDYLRRTIDRMAVYKLNVLHLHLTDDQGWRLEIRKHPELTQQAAFFSPKYSEPPSHQGFYTQAQMREIVAYAAARHITVVPEIEMPGHSHEVFVCRPELCCAGKTTGEIFPFFKGPTTTADVFCAGNENTFQFLQELLDEVVEVFPSRFVHVGGDEVPKTAWKSCPKCQARMKAEGLKDEHELQSYFIRRMERHLASKGRRMIGWDEILEGGLAPNAAVMSWRGASGGVAAAKAGHDAVMSPTSHCYFDYSYGEINSERAFSFDPLAGIAPEAARHVLGVQANFWSHIDREPELVDRQLFPRLLALAERGWSPDNRGDWPAYARRARAQIPRLERLGIHYQTTDLIEPAGEWSPSCIAGEKTVLEFDVTASLTKAGRYEVKPVYRRGAHGLFIHSVELLRNNEVVAGDQHEGFAGAQPKNDTYVLRLPAAPAGAPHRLRLTVSPGGGTNSWGQVFLTGPSPAN